MLLAPAMPTTAASRRSSSLLPRLLGLMLLALLGLLVAVGAQAQSGTNNAVRTEQAPTTPHVMGQ